MEGNFSSSPCRAEVQGHLQTQKEKTAFKAAVTDIGQVFLCDCNKHSGLGPIELYYQQRGDWAAQ